MLARGVKRGLAVGSTVVESVNFSCLAPVLWSLLVKFQICKGYPNYRFLNNELSCLHISYIDRKSWS